MIYIDINYHLLHIEGKCKTSYQEYIDEVDLNKAGANFYIEYIYDNYFSLSENMFYKIQEFLKKRWYRHFRNKNRNKNKFLYISFEEFKKLMLLKKIIL